jgi:adenylate cyclase
MALDETETVIALKARRGILSRLILNHNGRVVDSPGDNILAEFVSVVEAVKCALEIQNEIKKSNAALPSDRQMVFRIGVNLGDVIEDGARIYGDGVNIAARLEGLAKGGGICISGNTYEQIQNKVPVGCKFIGKQTVKNIATPVSVYRIWKDPNATI